MKGLRGAALFGAVWPMTDNIIEFAKQGAPKAANDQPEADNANTRVEISIVIDEEGNLVWRAAGNISALEAVGALEFVKNAYMNGEDT